MKSIRKEILRRVLAGSALLLAAAGVLLAATIHRQLVREFDYTLETKVKALATLTVREGDNLEIDFAPERPPVFTRGEDPECFQFRWPDGAPLLRSESLGEDELPMPESRRPLSFATVRPPPLLLRRSPGGRGLAEAVGEGPSILRTTAVTWIRSIPKTLSIFQPSSEDRSIDPPPVPRVIVAGVWGVWPLWPPCCLTNELLVVFFAGFSVGRECFFSLCTR